MGKKSGSFKQGRKQSSGARPTVKHGNNQVHKAPGKPLNDTDSGKSIIPQMSDVKKEAQKSISYSKG